MIYISFFLAIILFILLFPRIIPYILLGYMMLNGLASRSFINNFQITIASINIKVPDLLYATTFLLTLWGMGALFALPQNRRNFSRPSFVAIGLIFTYIIFFSVKSALAYFEHVPVDTLIRMFATDTQSIYFFIPLLYIRHNDHYRKLLLFIVAISLIFPFGQPFLYGSEDQIIIQKGQGTFRLGFGDANLFLAMGALAFFGWGRKVFLSVIPLTGIALLTHRSAYIAFSISLIALSILKRQKIKTMAITVASCLLIVLLLIGIQQFSSLKVADKLGGRLTETFQKTGTTKSRLLVIPLALETFYDHPLSGLSYQEKWALQKSEKTSAKSFNTLHPHNFLLTSLMETGVIGTSLLLSLLLHSLLWAYKLSQREAMQNVGTFLFSSMLFFIIFALMNTTLHSAGYIFWLLSGATFAHVNFSAKLRGFD